MQKNKSRVYELVKKISPVGDIYLWRMNSGFPLHLKVTHCPSGIALNFTSMVETANTSAEALIDVTNA